MISGNFKRKNNEKKPGYLRYDDVFMSNNSGYNSRSQDNLRRNQNFSSNRRQQDVYDNDYEDEYYNDDIPQENDDYDDRVSMTILMKYTMIEISDNIETLEIFVEKIHHRRHQGDIQDVI